MPTAVSKFKNSLRNHNVSEEVIKRIVEGHESVTDRSSKERQARFLIHAMRVMDETLDYRTRYEVRDECACSKHGWREKAVRKIAEDYDGRSIEERLQALRQIRYMGAPVLNDDGTITGGVGAEGGFPCPCPVLSRREPDEPVSLTYCLCCAGHFRHHYQIALGVRLTTKTVVSSVLASLGEEPCRFIFEIADD